MDIKGVFLAVILTAVLCISGNLLAYSGGTGAIGTPYQIANIDDFQQLSATPTDCNKSFILTANINLTGLTFTQAPIAPDTSTTPYFQGTQFTGIFDGNGHTISNLTISSPDLHYIGLFGYVGSGGQIRNLGVENVNLTGESYLGGLAGRNFGTLTSCYATGSVSGTFIHIGGLVGSNESGTLTSCYATSSVSGTGSPSDWIGGLVGDNYYGTLNSCYATGSVSGITVVGGLVGKNDSGTITACYATGSVTGEEDFLYVANSIGGLVGWNHYGSVTSCYATGSVIRGDEKIGGLVGHNEGSLTACYATGSVTGEDYTDYVGGLVGANWGALTACYATGAVTGEYAVGGLVGWNNYDGTLLTSCFWDIQTCFPVTVGVGVGVGPSTGVTGKSTAAMKNLSTFTNAGWDFSYTDGDPADWQMPADENYPRLVWEENVLDYGGGTGTAENPYKISNVAYFQHLSTSPHYFNNSFILTADIDLTGLTFTQAPIAPDTSTSDNYQGTSFTGIFDGNGHTISNLTITAPIKEYIGLFGNVGSGGQIRNLGVEDVNIIGRNRVGGLVGYNHGTLTSCYTTGSVTGTGLATGDYVGGLVGHNYEGTLISCYATGSVTGGAGGLVGGLVGGSRDGTLISCYATGSVTGYAMVGGLVGWNYRFTSGTVTSCYATGSVSGSGTVGGLVGWNNSGLLVSCYATGSVSVTGSSVGGLVGSISNSGTVTSCYATGSVSGTSSVGGLVGSISNSGTVTTCYAIGSVSGTGSSVGGLVGYNYYGPLTDCFWDMETSGKTTSAGGTGKTTVQMKTLSTFTSPPASWDFSATWQMPANSYPRLAWERVSLLQVSNWPASLTVEKGGTLEFTFDLSRQTAGSAVLWTVSAAAASPWVSSITPSSGSSVSPEDITTITVSIDAGSLDVGTYTTVLLVNDGSVTLERPVSIRVVNYVDVEEFAILGSYWGMTGCNETQLCSNADWFTDGEIDILDLRQLCISWLGEEMIYDTPHSPEITDGFETGNFSALPWVRTGNANWTIVSTGTYEGTYSAKSGTITHSQASTLEVAINTADANSISFVRKVSSEANYDYLKFYIDGVEKNKWSGTADWAIVTFTFTPGQHTFKWSYTKNGSVSSSSDCAWIDNVRIYQP